MTYALRKLIAFVFLLGIVWFIYRDPSNLGQDWFMHALGVLALAFAVFYVVVPWVVVAARIRRRRAKNRADFAAWRARHGADGVRPLTKAAGLLRLKSDERTYWHAKGTLYLPRGTALDALVAPGKPGEVAFPGLRRIDRRIQRVHFYVTDRRLLFLGKELNLELPREAVASVAASVGGVVLQASGTGCPGTLAFTCSNPLVLTHVLAAVHYNTTPS